MKKKYLFFSSIAFLFIAVMVMISGSNLPMVSAVQQESFEERRTRTLNELSESIDAAIAEGEYGCCIEPACTMCYMGSWLWSDGVCRCDEMIASGQMDKVCPECKRGIEEGRCTGKPTVECSVE